MTRMPDSVKILLLHDLKLDIERRAFEIVGDIRYERLRYDLREKYDILAMEAMRKVSLCRLLWDQYFEVFRNNRVNGT
ncbi:MAG: hypothetical protein WBZ36_30635 [Candidatus Nitrosopolaris sp.]